LLLSRYLVPGREILKQHPVHEDVSTTNFAKKNVSRSIVEEANVMQRSKVLSGVSHLLHIAFFTGLYDSRSQPYVVTPRNTKSHLPSACSPPLWGGKPLLCLAAMEGRLSLIVLCHYPLRHVSHGNSTVVKGGEMAITVQMQFTSAVTEIYQDAFVGSSIENGTTVIQFDLRKHDFHQELGTQATLCWRKDSYQVDVHEGFQIVSEKFYTVDDFNPHITKFNKMIIVWRLASS
jgi:hypothetical protein